MAIRWEEISETAGHLASHLGRTGTPEASADILPVPSAGIRWEPVSGLSPDAIRDVQAQGEYFTDALAPTGAAAWRELLSPYHALANVLHGRAAGATTPEEQTRQADLYRRSPLAYMTGSIAGSLPSFLLAGEATAPMKALPLLQRLMQMGRLGRAASTAVPLASQFGLQSAIQGAPEQSPRQALIGMLMGAIPGALRSPPTPEALPPMLPAPPERLQLPGPPTEAASAIPSEVTPIGYDPHGAFRTGELPFPVKSTIPRKYQVRPPNLGQKPIRKIPVGKTPSPEIATASKVTRQDLINAERMKPISYPQVGSVVSYGKGETSMKVISVDKASGLVEVYNPSLDEQVPVHISDIRTVAAKADLPPTEQKVVPKKRVSPTSPPRRPSKEDLGMVGGSD